jgi:hypothetical protein
MPCSTIASFGKEFVKEGLLPANLHKAFRERQLCDYDVLFMPFVEEAEAMVENAGIFLEHLRSHYHKISTNQGITTRERVIAVQGNLDSITMTTIEDYIYYIAMIIIL